MFHKWIPNWWQETLLRVTFRKWGYFVPLYLSSGTEKGGLGANVCWTVAWISITFNSYNNPAKQSLWKYLLSMICLLCIMLHAEDVAVSKISKIPRSLCSENSPRNIQGKDNRGLCSRMVGSVWQGRSRCPGSREKAGLILICSTNGRFL